MLTTSTRRCSDVVVNGQTSKRINGDGGFWRKRRKSSVALNDMVAAMIPGAKMDSKGRVMINVACNKETVVFNIGGVMFETYKSTLYRLPNSPLANDTFLQEHFRPKQKDYFFDRDPDIFRATLNYLRTGELHIPSYICGPAAKNDLEFWGVKPNKIERCCWTNYNDWNMTLEALNQLDIDRKGSMMADEMEKHKDPTWWNVNQPKIWNLVSRPDSSSVAKIFGFISLFFVIFSIFSFIAGTTPTFQYKRKITTKIHNNFSHTSNFTTVSAESVAYANANGSLQIIKETNANTTERWVLSKHSSLHYIDIVCLVFFTIEYIVRLVFAPKRLQFAISVMGAIDLLAIIPDVIEIIVYVVEPDMIDDSSIADVITMFRIARVLRIFRLIKHVPGLWILVYTLKASVGELVLLSCFMMVGILLYSSLLYFAEERDNIESIPHAFWWALITMTTVGYGDMFPKTVLGKLVGSLCAMFGLLMVGFSVPALVNNFMLFYKHLQFALQSEKEKRLQAKRESEQKLMRNMFIGNQFKIDGISTLTDDNDNTTQEVAPILTSPHGDSEGECV